MPAGARVIGSTPLLAIVRFHEGGDLVGTLDALLAGGIDVLEITIDTPGALRAIEQAAESGRSVGAGTVVSADQVRACADAGAQFVVSPGLCHEVVAAAHELDIEPMPGVFTATEILAATAAGARVMKLFPASPGGPAYLRALRAPFPEAALVPTGGVRLDQITSYLEAGATAVALGSELVGRSTPRSRRDLERITARAARAVAAARSAARGSQARPTGADGRPPAPTEHPAM